MTFQDRLKRVMEVGNLRVADLAKLFGRRHSTVRGWVVDGREPAGTKADVRELLDLLATVEQLARAWRSCSATDKRERIMIQFKRADPR